MNKMKVLYADNEENNLYAFQSHFRRKEKYEVIICSSSEQVEKQVKEVEIRVLIIDQAILETMGVEFLHVQNLKGTIVIAVTANRDFDIIDSAVKKGLLFKYHCKPFDLEDLNTSIEQALI